MAKILWAAGKRGAFFQEAYRDFLVALGHTIVLEKTTGRFYLEG